MVNRQLGDSPEDSFMWSGLAGGALGTRGKGNLLVRRAVIKMISNMETDITVCFMS